MLLGEDLQFAEVPGTNPLVAVGQLCDDLMARKCTGSEIERVFEVNRTKTTRALESLALYGFDFQNRMKIPTNLSYCFGTTLESAFIDEDDVLNHTLSTCETPQFFGGLIAGTTLGIPERLDGQTVNGLPTSYWLKVKDPCISGLITYIRLSKTQFFIPIGTFSSN